MVQSNAQVPTESCIEPELLIGAVKQGFLNMEMSNKTDMKYLDLLDNLSVQKHPNHPVVNIRLVFTTALVEQGSIALKDFPTNKHILNLLYLFLQYFKQIKEHHQNNKILQQSTVSDTPPLLSVAWQGCWDWMVIYRIENFHLYIRICIFVDMETKQQSAVSVPASQPSL